MTRSRAKTVRIIGSIGGIGLLIYMVFRYDPARILQCFLNSNGYILLAAFALSVLVQFLSAVPPLLLLGTPETGVISRQRTLKAFMAVQPFSLFAPGRLGDLGVVPLLRKHYKPGALTSVVVVDKLISLFLVCALVPSALIRVTAVGRGSTWSCCATGFMALMVSAPFVLMNHRFRRAANRLILSRCPGLLAGFGEHLEFLFKESKLRLLANLLLTAVKIGCGGLVLLLLSWNAGVDLTFFQAAAMVVILQVATIIPISIMGLGIAEGTLVFLFSINGFPEAAGVSICLMGRVLTITILVVMYYRLTLPAIAEEAGARDYLSLT